MPDQSVQQPVRAAIFTSAKAADRAVHQLLDADFRKDQISVMCADKEVDEHFEAFHHDEDVTKSDQPHILKSGAVGAALGGLVSLAGVVTTGGFGILAVGPILGGGVAGTLAGLFVGRGVENEVARFYEQEVTQGNILVAVDLVDDPEQQAAQLARAERIFQSCGAKAIPLDEG